MIHTESGKIQFFQKKTTEKSKDFVKYNEIGIKKNFSQQQNELCLCDK